jgi:uncharacterized membrane protein YqjE
VDDVAGGRGQEVGGTAPAAAEGGGRAGTAPPGDGRTRGRAARRDDDPRSTGDVIASLVANVQGLVRTELELAKLEVSTIVKQKVIAIVAFAGAALLGLFILGFVGVTAAVALQLVVEPWLAWLIVTLTYMLLALIAVVVGVRLVKRSVVPEQTKQEAVRTAEWAKEQAKATAEDLT